VEHVADLDGFLAATAAVLRPGGLLVASTLNRTAKSYLFAIVAAEYVLRWLPRGTHRWDRFLRPSELAAGLRGNGLTLRELRGLTRGLTGEWRVSTDLSVNYFAMAIRTAG
jgi:2-polyprenyl-6-hydroxyphenyl methylase / 3-demethylubiquinone-9 3-methyltransferase